MATPTSVKFVEQQYAATLASLHKEVQLLKDKNSDLAFRLIDVGRMSDELIGAKKRISELEQSCVLSKQHIHTLEKNTDDQSKQLHNVNTKLTAAEETIHQLQLKLNEYEELNKRHTATIKSLELDLSQRSAKSAQLMLQLHKAKVLQYAGDTDDTNTRQHPTRANSQPLLHPSPPKPRPPSTGSRKPNLCRRMSYNPVLDRSTTSEDATSQSRSKYLSHNSPKSVEKSGGNSKKQIFHRHNIIRGKNIMLDVAPHVCKGHDSSTCDDYHDAYQGVNDSATPCTNTNTNTNTNTSTTANTTTTTTTTATATATTATTSPAFLVKYSESNFPCNRPIGFGDDHEDHRLQNSLENLDDCNGNKPSLTSSRRECGGGPALNMKRLLRAVSDPSTIGGIHHDIRAPSPSRSQAFNSIGTHIGELPQYPDPVPPINSLPQT